jgi:hypothetical protein
MKKQFRLLMVLATLFTLVMVLPARGQDAPPPPPAHSANGNQGTGCPLDRTQGIMLALVLSLGYAGFALYQRGKKEVAKDA